MWGIYFILCSSQQTDLPSSNVCSYVKDNLGALKTWDSDLVIIIGRSPRNSGEVCLSWFQPARSKKIHLIQSRWLSIKYNLVLIGATLTSTCEVCFVVYKSSFKCSNTHFSIWFPVISLGQQHTSYQLLSVCEMQGRFSNKNMSKQDRCLPQAAVHDGLCYLSPDQLSQILGCPRLRDQWVIQGPCSLGRTFHSLSPTERLQHPIYGNHKLVGGIHGPCEFQFTSPLCGFLLEVTPLVWQPYIRLEFTLVGYSQKTSASLNDLTL